MGTMTAPQRNIDRRRDRRTAAAEPVIQAFTADHVVGLTGLSRHQLRTWDKTGFFAPHRRGDRPRSPYNRIYSFKDVVGLKAISILLKDHGVSLRHLRKVAERLGTAKDDMWSRTRLYVLHNEVHFEEPETGAVKGPLSDQYAVIPLIRIINDISRDAKKLQERSAEQIGTVERHRHVARNSWVVAGTRIPTGAIRRFSDEGYTVDQILREYPSLTGEDVAAALGHEARLANGA